MLELKPAYRSRILCTEDDADTREVLRLLLEMDGFDVTCAEDSKQALSLARAGTFDLYLLDNWLPDALGDVLCRDLREFDLITPILFYSGAATEADKARAMACGAQGYLIKPANFEDLVGEMRRLIKPN
jgi:two-component system, OmpR family, alkaline phosphatase synthesis response regulator PhoP